MPITTAGANASLDARLDGSTISLHTQDPTDDGSVGEVVGGAYTRQASAFAVASGGSKSSNADVEYVDMPAVTVTHAAFWQGSTCVWTAALDSSKALNAGDTFIFRAGDITLSIN